ncbi:hypothetical protein [Candidatus Symbiothrix dinenymphae]|uniref:hypothetical protein n=1 Tax=Candidatus Symbiothrix dinenymphae TaxID=467085 RepID=UPI0006E1701D|nr:hypothetical protein [Candidatus Symbiothrix dinenymphae]
MRKSEAINAENEAINESVKKEVHELYDHIKNNPLIKRTDIIIFIGKSKTTVERYLKILKDNNLIEYIGSLKTGGYRIIK